MFRNFVVRLLLLLSSLTPTVFAQTYPARAIRIIVPFSAGGPSDFVARSVGLKLMEAWGQEVTVENLGGQAGALAAERVARAAPDGYTLLLGTTGVLSVLPAQGKPLPFQPERDFAPVARLVTNTQILVVHPSLQVASVRELIALAKNNPGKLRYGSVGEGSLPHLGMELFKAMTETDMPHVPFPGAAPAIADLVEGKVSLMFVTMPTVVSYVESGKLRGIAVASPKRSAVLPAIPTVAESGVPGFAFTAWYGLFAPAGTPQSVVTQLNTQIVNSLGQMDLSRRLSNEGAEPAPSTPTELGQLMREDTERWKALIKKLGSR